MILFTALLPIAILVYYIYHKDNFVFLQNNKQKIRDSFLNPVFSVYTKLFKVPIISSSSCGMPLPLQCPCGTYRVRSFRLESG